MDVKMNRSTVTIKPLWMPTSYPFDAADIANREKNLQNKVFHFYLEAVITPASRKYVIMIPFHHIFLLHQP